MAVGAWHIVIGGFGQRTGQLSGAERIWQELIEIQSPQCCVLFFEWDHHFASLADLIARASVNCHGPEISVYAFSWGAGYGFIQLARRLKARGYRIRIAVLGDPVYRSRLCLFRWLAFVPSPIVRIRVPDNVDEVRGVYQAQSCLRGHRVVACDPSRTTVHPFLRRSRDHIWIDDDPVFHRMCRRAAGVE